LSSHATVIDYHLSSSVSQQSVLAKYTLTLVLPVITLSATVLK
jgi:hypothetical protein